MWSVNVMILLLFCYACLATGDGSVKFISKNFYNVLHWDPLQPSFPGQKVLYSVQYWRDDEEQYWIKHECQNITHLSCDLTAETPSVYDVHYRAKVMVNGTCMGITKSFTPFRETVLGPPHLSLHTTPSTLHVNVTLPLGPNGVSIADIITSSKKGLIKAVPEYILTITTPEWAAQVITNKTGQFEVILKYNQSKYCGHVVYLPTPEWGRIPSEKAPFCVTLPDNHQIPLQWVLLSIGVLVAIIILSAVCIWNYVKDGNIRSIPEALVIPTKQCKVLQHQDKNLRISEVSFGIHWVQNQIQDQKKINLQICRASCDLPCGYSPQVDPEHIFQCNPETSAESSGSYGAVAVQTLVEANEENLKRDHIAKRQTIQATLPCGQEEKKEKGGIIPQTSSYGAPQLPNFNGSEGTPEQQPLVINAVRNIDGQLMLALSAFQLQTSPCGIELQINTERKPLLEDVIFQNEPMFTPLERQYSDGRDSGCYDSNLNTPTSPFCNPIYSSSETMHPSLQQECQTMQPVDAICHSGYKQNGLSAFLTGLTDIH
ncbi:interferon lambda receptor 1 [Cyprinodon tularosa]|uniref:interferon lambda receptor 1 n=1 Tax=Cyprinodon tularosa TaxID=77115 RepID=UPI0018E20876|nr:interferon lambda receptor 1 [Cyprinodon tularosa]